MIIFHLLFAHLLADYTLQTNWLIVRKSAWDGLLLHGLTVLVMSILVLPSYLSVAFVPLLILVAVHTAQDWLKLYLGPRIKLHPFVPYMADQFLHYAAILVFQAAVGPQLQPPPSAFEQFFMAAGSVTIAVTRSFDVTWWANWLEMIPYMNRWQLWGFAERGAMVVLAMAGLFIVAPLCTLPRLVYSHLTQSAIWKQPRGLLELCTGIVFSVALGLLLRNLMLSLSILSL